MSTDHKARRCEGYRRRGGAFTLGPATWEQCDRTAEVMLKVSQPGEPESEMPACMTCWREAQKWPDVKILGASPLPPSDIELRYCVSNDGGKTCVKVSECPAEALSYLDKQNVDGLSDYCVVVKRSTVARKADLVKKFTMKHTLSDAPPQEFDETNAPDWLTSKNTRPGSTADMRWFWEQILTMKVGESKTTDFRKITRIQ